MVKLLITFACFLPMLLQAQGFGSYTFDQPFLAKSRVLLSGVDLTNGCIAYWDMQEAGNIDRQDVTAYNRDLTDEHSNVNATTGIWGLAAYSDSFSETHKLLSSDAAFGGSGSFSVALWAKATEIEDSLNPITTRYNVTGWGVWALFFYESRMKTIFAGADGTWYSLTNYPTGLYLDQWAFYAFGYDASTAKGWTSTNGVVIAETPVIAGGMTNVASGTIPLVVMNWTGLDNAWIGPVDEMGFWDRRLSTNEIIALYNSGTGLTYTNFNSVKNP